MNENIKNLEKIQYNKQNYKMSLLFIQTKELKRFYDSKMENSLKTYNLVDKDWLDNYKEKNDYNLADMFDTFNDWKNYEDFREVMGDSFLVDDIFFSRINKTIPCKKIKFKYDINYPENVELLCKQYVIDCLKGSVTFPMYNILIGDKSIIIIDEESKMNNKAVIFICSLIGKKEDYNFAIKVDYIIIYNNINIMNEELKEICLSNGINNYLLKRKIDVKNSEEQKLIDAKNENIGKFLIATKEEEKSKSINYEIKNPFYNINQNNQNNQNNSTHDNNDNINYFTNFNNFNNNIMIFTNNNFENNRNFNNNNRANNIDYNPNNFHFNNKINNMFNNNMNNNINFELNNNNLNFNNNNLNFNNNINFINQSNNGDDDDFNIHFRYKSKEVVLYIKPNMKFNDIQKELLDNYDFLKQINIKGFSFRNQMINPDYTCQQLNIKSSSKIFIIEN